MTGIDDVDQFIKIIDWTAGHAEISRRACVFLNLIWSGLEFTVKEIKSVAILGAGAMGTMYASKFVDSGHIVPAFVASGTRYEKLKSQECLVIGKKYAVPVIHPAHATEPVDLIIVAVKNHQLEEAAKDLASLVGAETTILSVMNGLDSEEFLGSMFGMDKILYAIALGMDAVREGGSVSYSNPGKILFGKADNSVLSDRVIAIQNAFRNSGIQCDTPVDMIRMMWWKFMINVGVNQASAVMRAPYGVFHASRDAQELMSDLMREVITLAQHSDVRLDDQDLVNWYPVLHGLGPEGKTSMLQDIEAKRKTEVEVFAGKVVRRFPGV